MEAPTREKIFEMAAKKLRQDFQELRVVPHAALKGGEAEELVRSFLRDHIPRRFDVGAGFILDRKNSVSKQTDVIVFDALNCPTYRASESAAIYPANNVAAVVEVKSKLDTRELEDAFSKIASVKSLVKARSIKGDDDAIVVSQTYGSVFAYESAISLDSVADCYAKWIKTNGLGHHADVVCILDKGLTTTAAKLRNNGWVNAFLEGLGGPQAEGAHLAISIQPLGETSLDAFFRLLLVHLKFFQSAIDHPGLDWGAHLPQGMMKLIYIGSITNELDPEKRRQKLEEYTAQVRKEFTEMAVPPNWPT